ncbi:MAG: SAM-dependent methyltransferase [Microbacterium sp.]
MSWPFLYFPGDRLSTAELTCARLDGDVVEIGDAYMPTDAVETRELRASSLRNSVLDTLAVTRESAVWIYGAVPEPPPRHTVQRRSPVRLHHVLDARLEYHDQLLRPDAVIRIGGVWVTTPEHTLADLVRALHAGEDVARHAEALLGWRPALATEALNVLRDATRWHHKRPAIAWLRDRAQESAGVHAGDQEEVTRYTS